MIIGKAFALIGSNTVSIATVGNAHRLAAQGIGLTQSFSIALGADTFARLDADLVMATGGVALGLTEASGAV